MKVILENATELLDAFERLSHEEQTSFLKALQQLISNPTKRDATLNPEDFFGIWAGQNVDATLLRKEAWGDSA